MNKRVGAIDLGTNTVRLLVAEGDSSGYRPLFSDQVITRLGQSLHTSGLLAPEAIERTVKGVVALLKRAEPHAPFDLTIFATSAAREARNGDALQQAMRSGVGQGVEIIDQQREAAMALKGAASVVASLPHDYLLLDIGGGSTEFILSQKGRLAGLAGTDLGVVRLAETYITLSPTNAGEYAALRREIDQKVDAAFEQLGAGEVAVVGTAGTVTSLAAIALGLKEYDPARINRFALTRSHLMAIKKELMGMTLGERSAYPALAGGREDLIIPGVAIIESVMRRSGQERILVSDDGVREGLIRELLAL